MTPEQWTTLVGQLGVGGAAVFVILKVVVPLLTSKLDAIVEAIRANTEANNRMAAAVAQNTERLARLEGIFDHVGDRTPTPVEAPRTLGGYRPPSRGGG